MEQGTGKTVEYGVYGLLVLAVCGDFITTYWGLGLPGIIEFNPVARQLMSRGIWLPVYIFLVELLIIVPFQVIRHIKNEWTKIILVFPLSAGVIGFTVFLRNLSLIMSLV